MIIGIAGPISSGKSTIGKILKEKHGFEIDSMAKTLKDICSILFDWPRDLLEGDTRESREFREKVDHRWSKLLDIENFTPRFALQYIGTDVFRNNFHNDIWVLTIKNRLLKNLDKNIVITDCRFFNELKEIKSIKNSITVMVKNSYQLPEYYNIAVNANHGKQEYLNIMMTKYKDIHTSEWGWMGFNFDYEILNNKGVNSISGLENKVDDLIKRYK